MRTVLAIALMLTTASQAHANDWEKFYKSLVAQSEVQPAQTPPEIINSVGSVEQDIAVMWRRGFVIMGYSSFNSPNSKTQDAVRFAKKLQAQYIILNTELVSSSTSQLPITAPTTTTSITNGRVSAIGNGGYASGNYSGTTTTYGSQTTYIPITVNRFDKSALYFGSIPREGSGILPRDLTPSEVATFETQRGFVVRAVREGSPADVANVLPGDTVLELNGGPIDKTTWREALIRGDAMKVRLVRNGTSREILMSIPPEWRPQK